PLAHGDQDERLEGEADGVAVNDSAVAADRSAALELPEPAVARRDAQPHPGSQLGDGQATVLLEQRKNLSVNPVHGRILPRACRAGMNVASTFRLVRDILPTTTEIGGIGSWPPAPYSRSGRLLSSSPLSRAPTGHSPSARHFAGIGSAPRSADWSSATPCSP